MEDDDDDLYDPADAVPTTQHHPAQNPQSNAPTQGTDEGEEEEIEVEEDDDDFNIITEAPPDAPLPEVPHPRRADLRTESQRPSSVDSQISKSVTPSATPKVEIATPVPASARPAVPQKPGSSYPPVHASTIDVNGNPVHPATGKPIMSTDLDADFPDDDKPWRRPGSDISDYFNYGFDEFTWASYVIKQQELRKEIGDQKKQLEDMQNFLTMGFPMPGGPPPPPAGPGAGPGGAPPMPGMPGMPDMNPEMMQNMLASMMAQGLDPSSMDPMSFMNHAQAMMPNQSGAGGGQQGQFGGQGGGYGGGYGGGRGRGRRW